MMIDELCSSDGLRFLGNFGVWELIEWSVTLIAWVGLLVVLALLVAWIIRRAGVTGGTVPYATAQPGAREILQTRYARGEITREEFNDMKQVIGKAN